MCWLTHRPQPRLRGFCESPTGPDRQAPCFGCIEVRPITGSQQEIGKPNNEKVPSMLYTIAVVLLILWVLGLVSSYTLGGFVHILLVIAIVMILVNVISGRRSP